MTLHVPPQPKPIDEFTSTIQQEDDDDDDNVDDAFMNDILNGMTGPPTYKSDTTTATAKKKEEHDTNANNDDFSQDLLAGMDRMMREMGMAAEPDPRSSSTEECSSFQARIQKTVNQLEEPTPMENSDDDDELIKNLMSEMEHLADTPEFESVLETMMQSLMSKEILHEPMRDLCAQYPDYIKSHPEMPENERQRLLAQLELMQQVNLIYETETHTCDSSPRIMELMGQIQALGQPPAELMSGIVPDGAVDKECCIM